MMDGSIVTFAICILFSIFSVWSEECQQQQYLDVSENSCKPLPFNFSVLLNATQYDVIIFVDEESMLSADSFIFGITLYINNGTFMSSNIFHLELNSALFKFSSTGGGSTDIVVFNDENKDLFLTYEYQVEASDNVVPGFYQSSILFTVIGNPTLVLSPVNFSVNITEKSLYVCDGSECANGGACIPSVDSFSCNCNDGYFGDKCENASNPCEPNPCGNNTCSPVSLVEYNCECTAGYTGQNCSINIDDCLDINCGNGTCIDLVNDYQCDCLPGYTGDDCLTDINECESSPCVNGICQDQINDFSCSCFADWTGVNCEIDNDLCFGGDFNNPNFPCDTVGYQNCIDGNGTFSCNCRAGFTGETCAEDINECADNPCLNGGSCNDNINAYSCMCAYGYTGTNCDVVIDFCEEMSITCSKNGNCSNIEGVGYECICNPGYANSNCSQEINECVPDPCLNGATCIDLINDFECMCPPDFTGQICNSVIDHCDPDPCQNEATCIDLVGQYQCICLPDFTGETCATELLLCSDTACMNGGSCSEEDGGSTTICLCPDGFSGDECEIDDEVCNVSPEKCLNGATCIEGYGNEYSCSCMDGFGGSDCSFDLNFCNDTVCKNGGSCIEEVGEAISCECSEGFSGENCEIDKEVCNVLPLKCFNGGFCNEGYGSNYTCSCLSGFDGFDCSEDVNFCNETYCENGGTCVDGYGTEFFCQCPAAFGGDQCETELVFCMTNYCLNGGSCVDVDGGSATLCMCTKGFSGDQCEFDDDVCNELPLKCFNEGSCIEGYGVNYTCQCKIGFEGNDCSIDGDFCSATSCLNGGTCIEEYGNKTTCTCPDGYTGKSCETGICSDDYCYNNGICSVVNDEPTCTCNGCEGDRCEIEVDSCTVNLCFNGGTCMEQTCSNYTCNCESAYTGYNCEIPICQGDSCLNGGLCSVVNNELRCECPLGFNGTKCEIDVEYCNPNYCENGGTCIEGVGINVSCDCSDCFSGDLCEVDELVCEPGHCHNGGTCVEEFGCNYSCNCTEAFAGYTCEQAICPFGWCYNGGSCSVENNITVCSCGSECSGDRCELDSSSNCSVNPCFNGGTCVSQACLNYTCQCLSTYTGNNCEIPICQTDSCMNGGTCSVLNNEIFCKCPAGFDGKDCGTDLDHCTDNYCQNNGTCVEEVGDAVSCNCTNCFSGDRCQTDVMFCSNLSDYCLNGGSCVDDLGCDYHCDCTYTFTGEKCETSFCPDNWCYNGGDCFIDGNQTRCSCDTGCSGERCEEDESVCNSNTCKNGGTCTDGICLNYTCFCPPPFTGQNCETIECQADSCLNGGTCRVESNALVCDCLPDYTGKSCETIVDISCQVDSDCSADFFCKIDCNSDDYPSHIAMLFEPVTLFGVSFVSVEEARHPTIATEFSLFAVYNQDPTNRGYLVYFGTTAQSRNLGIFLDSVNSKFYLYYTNTTGHLRSYIITNNIFNTGGFDSFLAVTFKGGVINVYVNGSFIEASSLTNVDFTYGISDISQATTKLFIGARYPRHFRFIGTVKQVIFFESVLSQSFLVTLQNEFYSVSDPIGECVPFKSLDSLCFQPTEAPSILCTTSKERCGPSYSCLPLINGSYTCQLKPPTCISDLECTDDYFCGSEQPFNGSNYFENSFRKVSGETVFLQDSSVVLDGEDVVTLPAKDAPTLNSDITIFGVVFQEPNNDGYVIGKGINGNLRDFGLYLRSSRKTVWLVYGADNHGIGYKEIVFFHNVTVADGKYHSVAAVVDSTANRTQLYIDGIVVGQQSPLPSLPTFRPGHNLLYVGGRPSTKYFRFKGTIRNLFVSSAPLQKDTIMQLHNDAMDGDEKVTLDLPTSRFCLKYRSDGEPCLLGGETSDFRCKSPAVCIPEFSSYEPRNLPSTNSTFQQLGVCVDPCNCNSTEKYECGADGNTYKNSCFRQCVQVTLLHDGRCSEYSDLYSS